MKNNYSTYENALYETGLENLKSRRTTLCLNFAKKCLKNEKTEKIFPLNPNYNPTIRKSEKYKVKFANTSRLQYSAIPALQRLLNEDSEHQEKPKV